MFILYVLIYIHTRSIEVFDPNYQDLEYGNNLKLKRIKLL